MLEKEQIRGKMRLLLLYSLVYPKTMGEFGGAESSCCPPESPNPDNTNPESSLCLSHQMAEWPGERENALFTFHSSIQLRILICRVLC